jgi:hypothetical protein
MFDRSLCLNINHPDVKKWVNSVGKENMYKIFVQNGYFLPDYDSYSEGEKLFDYSVEQIKSFLNKLVPTNQYEFDTLNALKSKGFDIQGTAAFYKKTFFFKDKVSKNELAEEAFHGIVQTLMDNNEQTIIYNAGRELLTQRLKIEKKSFSEYIKELQNKFPNVSREVLDQYAYEEEIAKDFVNYYNSEGKSNRYSQNRISNLTKKLSFLGKNAQRAAELLHTLYERIKSLLNLTSNETEILALFNKISNGEYSDKKIVNNNDNIIPSFRIYYNTNNKIIPSDEISQMKKSIAVIAKNINESEGINVSENSVIELAIEKYSDFLKTTGKKEKNDLKKKTLVDLYRLLKLNSADLIEEITEQFEANKTIFDESMEFDVAAKEDDQGRTQNFDDSANQQTLESRSKELDIMINTTGNIVGAMYLDASGKTIAYESNGIITDLDGNILDSAEGIKINIMQIPDSKMIYSAIARKLSNTKSENERFLKLIQLSMDGDGAKLLNKGNNFNTKTFINALLKDVLKDTSEKTKLETIEKLKGTISLSDIIKSDAKPLHIQRFLLALRGFNLFARNVYRTEIDIELGWGKVSNVESNSQRNNQKKFWSSNYRELQAKTKELEKYKKNFNDLFDDFITQVNFPIKDQKVINKLTIVYDKMLTQLGVDVNEEYLLNFITDLVNNNNLKLLSKEPLTLSVLIAKLRAINDMVQKEDKFLELYEEDDLSIDAGKSLGTTKDFNALFNFIADGNIEYDERVAETSYKDGNDNIINKFQNPTYTLKFANSFQSQKEFDELLEGGIVGVDVNGNFIRSTILDSFKKENPLIDMISIDGQVKEALRNEIKSITLDTTQLKSYSYKTDEGFLIEKDSEYTEKNVLSLGDMGAAEYALTNLILLTEYAKKITYNGKDYLYIPVSLGHNEASKQIDYLMIPFDGNAVVNNKLSEDSKKHVFKLIKTEFDKIKENSAELRKQVELLKEHRKVSNITEITRNDLLELVAAGKYEIENIYESYNTGKITYVPDGDYYSAGKERNKDFKGLQFSPEVEPFINKELLIKALKGEELTIEDENLKFDSIIEFLNEEVKWFNKQNLMDKLPHAIRDSYFQYGKTVKTEGKNTSKVQLFAENSKAEDRLKTALFNYWLGSTMANRMRYGSHNFNFKLTSSEAFKRYRTFNGATLNVKTSIRNKAFGIDKDISAITYATIEEPLAISDVNRNSKPIEQADGATKSTPRGLRKILHGINQLTKRKAEVLDKVEQGVELTAEEWDNMVNSDSLLSAVKPLGANGEQVMKTGLTMTLTLSSTAYGTVIEPSSINGNKFIFGNDTITVDEYGRTSQTKGNKREIIWDNTNKVFKEWKPRLLDAELTNYSQRMFLNGYRKNDQGEWMYRGEPYEIDIIMPPSVLKTSQRNILPFLKDEQGNKINGKTNFGFDDKLNSKYTFANAIDADYFGEQVQNPQGKLRVTTPTQNIEILSNELTGNITIKIIEKITNKVTGEVKEQITEQEIESNDLLKIYEELKKSRNINGKELAVSELFKKVRDNDGNIKEVVDYKYFFDGLIQGLKLTGGSGQDYEFLTVNPDGSPTYNVNIPLNKAKMIQSVVKHFSTGVLSHKVAGNAYVLASDHGVKVLKKLRIVKDEKGEIDYTWDVINNKTEGYDQIIIENKPKDLSNLIYDHRAWQTGNKEASELQMYFESPEIQARIANGEEIYFSDSLRYMKKSYTENGKFNTWVSEAVVPKLNGKQKSIQNSIRFMLGVRIPSQDKQSSVNIEWVDFLDDTIGNTIVVPKEIVQIAGSDFDIDKLFTTQYEGYWENGEYIKYEDTFEDYKKWIFKSSKAAKLVFKELKNTPQALNDFSIWNREIEVLNNEIELFDSVYNTLTSSKDKVDYIKGLLRTLRIERSEYKEQLEEFKIDNEDYFDLVQQITKIQKQKIKSNGDLAILKNLQLELDLYDTLLMLDSTIGTKEDIESLFIKLAENSIVRDYYKEQIKEYKENKKDLQKTKQWYRSEKYTIIERKLDYIDGLKTQILTQFGLFSSEQEFKTGYNNAVINNKILDYQRAMLTSSSVLFSEDSEGNIIPRGTGDTPMDLSLLENLQRDSIVKYLKSDIKEETLRTIYGEGVQIEESEDIKGNKYYDVYAFIQDGKEILTIEKNNLVPHNTLTTHANYQQGTIIARQGIGTVVNGMLMAIVANRISLQLTDKFKLNYDGDSVKFGYTDHLLERVFGTKNTLTSATTDEAKEEQLKKHGIKGDDLTVVDLLVSLEFSLDEAIAIVNSKKVKEYKDSIDRGKLESKADKRRVLSKEEDALNKLVIKLKSKESVDLNRQQIFESLYNDNEDILATYLRVADMGKELLKLAKLIKGKKGYTEGTLSELTDIEKIAIELGLISTGKEYKATGYFDWTALKSPKAADIQSFVDITQDLKNTKLNQMFIEYQDISQMLKEGVLSETNNSDNSALASKIEKDANTFLIIQLLKRKYQEEQEKKEKGESYDNSIDYIIDFLNIDKLNPLSNDNFLNKFFENKSEINEDSNQYKLLKHLIGVKGKINTVRNSDSVDSLRMSAISKLNPAQQDNIRNLFLEMYTSPNEEEKQFAKDLFAYFILKDGLQFRQYNISKIFPTIMFREISKVLDNFESIIESISPEEQENLVVKFKSLWFSDIRNKKYRLKLKGTDDSKVFSAYRIINKEKTQIKFKDILVNQPPLYLEITKNGEKAEYDKVGINTAVNSEGITKPILPQYIDYFGASYRRTYITNKIKLQYNRNGKTYEFRVEEEETPISDITKIYKVTSASKEYRLEVETVEVVSNVYGNKARLYEKGESGKYDKLVENAIIPKESISELKNTFYKNQPYLYIREPYYGSTITDLTVDAGLIPAASEVNTKQNVSKSAEENRSKLQDLIYQLKEEEKPRKGYIQYYENLLSKRYSPNFDKGYNEGMNNQNEEIQNTTDEIYSKLEKKTQSLNVVLPKDLGLVYNSKTFWSEFFPEFKANYGDQVIVAYRGNGTKSFAENFKSNGIVQKPVTIGNPFDIKEETGTAKEKGIKATKKFIDWLITGNNYDIVSATAEYRNLIINNIKNGELKGRPIGYYEEKNYATHATALDYLINEYDWNSNVNINFKPFKVETKVQIDAEKAPFKSERANGGFIGFGRNNSSTEFYAEQYQNRNAPVNPSVYEIGKTYFASINGGTSYTEKDFTNRDKAFQEIVKALNSGAFVLLDSKSYIDKGKGYNKLGEGWIHDELNKLGFKNTDSTINPDVTKWENPNINQAQPANTVNNNFNNVELFKGFWTREQVTTQPEKVFLFGDNTDDRLNTKYIPSSTQAVIRDLPNAIGIDTKKNRGTNDNSYFTDADFLQFKQQIDNAIQQAKNSNKVIVIPADGIGTGKAMLKEKAPKLFNYLQQELNKLQAQPASVVDTSNEINIYAGTGENAELSNFAERPVTIGDQTFRTPEGAFQAMKIWFTNAVLLNAPASKENLKIVEQLKNASGSQAKALGRKITDLSQATWDRDSSGIMKNILTLSFKQNPNALTKLLATGDATLTHTQDKTKWGKEFPKLLMEVREKLRLANNSVDIIKEKLKSFTKQSDALIWFKNELPKILNNDQIIKELINNIPIALELINKGDIKSLSDLYINQNIPYIQNIINSFTEEIGKLGINNKMNMNGNDPNASTAFLSNIPIKELAIFKSIIGQYTQSISSKEFAKQTSSFISKANAVKELNQIAKNLNQLANNETSNVQGTQSEVVGDISQEQLKLLQELQEVEARLETFLDTTDGIFYRYFKNGGRIKPESFDNLIDKNKRSAATNGAYIRKDGMSYDTLARAAYAMVNREETTDDKAVANLEEFILNYPNTWQTPYDNLKNNKKQIESELEILKTKGCQ